MDGFNLSDAVSGGNNQSGPWPNSPQPNQPTWPGQTPPNPVWPGGGNPQSGGMFGNAGTQSGGMFGGGVPQPGGQSGGGFPQPGGQFGGGFPQPGGQSGGGFPQPGGQSGGGFPQPGGQFGGGFPQPGGQSGGGFPQPGGQPSKPLVPYSQTLPRGVYDKLLITIRGTPNHNPNKFTVDLHAGRDLAFHLNPRFNENGHKVIVRNSSIGGKWGKEERELRNFPFVPGQPFEMKILCTHSEFKVAVDGSHLFEYKHRIRDLHTINRLGIHNDVSLTAVNMETLP